MSPPARLSPVRLLATTTGVAVLAGLLAWTAPPAFAAVTVDLTAGSGTIGVSQSITVEVASDAAGAPTGRITVTADGRSVGSHAVGGDQGSTVKLPWVPTTTGPVALRATFAADSNQTATDQLTVQISPVATTTTLLVPTTVTAGAKITLTATVAARAGSYVPTGTVTFRTTGGTSVGSASLNSSGTATTTWTAPTAPTASTVSLVADYRGDGKASGSISEPIAVKVTTTAPTVTLTAPAQGRVGSSVELTVKVTPTNATGTVAFTANGTSIGSAALRGGTARLSWKPTADGTFTLVATYPGGNGVGPGSATGRIDVVPALREDAITVVPQGSNTAWSVATPVPMANGTSVTLLASSTSGLPVQLTVAGPCALSANVLTVKGVGAACLLTASTKGNSLYRPAAQRYTVGTGVGTQTAHITAPPSRSVRRHTSLRLGRITATTNLGKPITWRVVSGATRCHVRRTTATYRIVFSRQGICRVRATAPGVPGQWAPFSVSRTYRIR